MTVRSLQCLLATLAFGAWSITVVAAERLEEAMSDTEFESAGLHRLAPAELEFLNRWLERGDARAAPNGEADFGVEQLPAVPIDPEEDAPSIRTRIDGAFRGWEGRTVFRLANGQVWQQRLSGSYRYSADAPEVILERGRFGYYLKVVATGRQISVKRLK